ncbi:unnamed protein product [Discosporangium mesarthrocarpum]
MNPTSGGCMDGPCNRLPTGKRAEPFPAIASCLKRCPRDASSQSALSFNILRISAWMSSVLGTRNGGTCLVPARSWTADALHSRGILPWRAHKLQASMGI